MRRIGNVESSSLAVRLIDYLLTLGITAVAEPERDDDTDGAQAIWVKEEPRVDEARQVFGEFMQSPEAEKYSVRSVAAKVRAELVAENRRRLQNQRSVSTSSSPLSVRQRARPMVTIVFTAICILASFTTEFMQPLPLRDQFGELLPSTARQAIHLLQFCTPEDYKATGNPFTSILSGEVWRLYTPVFLHGSISHLVVNMLSMFTMGSILERVHGRGRVLLLLAVTGLAGTIVQAVWPESNNGGPFGVGASGAGFGLFGYIWIRPLYDDRFPIAMPPSALILGIGFLALGVAEVVPRIANGGHVGGLIAGMVLAALLPVRVRGVRG